MARKTQPETTSIPRQMELADLDGKLAIFHTSGTDWDKPMRHANYWVSTIPASRYTELLGKTIWAPAGNCSGYGQVDTPWGGHMSVDYHDWTYTYVETPVEKPRDAKENTWEWDMGQWRVKWFPTCPECRKAHNPEWYDHCDWCGVGMPKGTRCAKCRKNHPED